MYIYVYSQTKQTISPFVNVKYFYFQTYFSIGKDEEKVDFELPVLPIQDQINTFQH